MDEKAFTPLQLVGLAALPVAFFVMFHTIARNRNRDRPWLWGLIGGLLYPVTVVGFFLWMYSLLKGDSLLNRVACLCPQCRKDVPSPYRHAGICPDCGARFRGI